MEKGAGPLGRGEEANEIDGIALEDVRIGDIQAAIVDAEIAGNADPPARAPAQRIEKLRQARRGLVLFHFQHRAKNGRQVADVFGD